MQQPFELYSVAPLCRDAYAHARIANSQMSTHLQPVGYQFVTTRCRTRTDKRCRIHRCYTLAGTAYPWFVYLHVKCIDLFHPPRRKINADFVDAPEYSVVLVWVGDRRKQFERWNANVRYATLCPPFHQYRNGLYRLPVSSPTLASLRRDDKNGILLRYSCGLLRDSFVGEENCKNCPARFFVLSLCIYYNQTSSLHYWIFDMLKILRKYHFKKELDM